MTSFLITLWLIRNQNLIGSVYEHEERKKIKIEFWNGFVLSFNFDNAWAVHEKCSLLKSLITLQGNCYKKRWKNDENMNYTVSEVPLCECYGSIKNITKNARNFYEKSCFYFLLKLWFEKWMPANANKCFGLERTKKWNWKNRKIARNVKNKTKKLFSITKKTPQYNWNNIDYMFDEITYTTPSPTTNNKLQQQSRQIELEKSFPSLFRIFSFQRATRQTRIKVFLQF